MHNQVQGSLLFPERPEKGETVKTNIFREKVLNTGTQASCQNWIEVSELHNVWKGHIVYLIIIHQVFQQNCQ